MVLFICLSESSDFRHKFAYTNTELSNKNDFFFCQKLTVLPVSLGKTDQVTGQNGSLLSCTLFYGFNDVHNTWFIKI